MNQELRDLHEAFNKHEWVDFRRDVDLGNNVHAIECGSKCGTCGHERYTMPRYHGFYIGKTKQENLEGT